MKPKPTPGAKMPAKTAAAKPSAAQGVAGTVVGALVGAEIDRAYGKSAVKGAIIGALVAGGLRRLGPFGLVIGAAYVAKKAYDRYLEAREGEADTATRTPS